MVTAIRARVLSVHLAITCQMNIAIRAIIIMVVMYMGDIVLPAMTVHAQNANTGTTSITSVAVHALGNLEANVCLAIPARALYARVDIL